MEWLIRYGFLAAGFLAGWVVCALMCVGADRSGRAGVPARRERA